MAKSNSLKVSIPNPCSYGWNNMTVTEDRKGKHCAACNKIVVDFTAMSTEDLTKFLKENRGVKTCGYFKTTDTTAPKWFQKPLLNLYNSLEKGYSRNKMKMLGLFFLGMLIYLTGCMTRTAGEMALPSCRDTTAIDTL